MSTTKKNYIYSLIYQIFILMFPILITPYTSRVLGSTALGINSYIWAILSYFIMFSKLGCSSLGSRLIAKNRDDIEKRSKAFFEIYYIQFTMTILMSILYLLFSILFLKDKIVIALIKSISLFAVFFEVSWVFNGLEKFKTNISKNVIIKIFTFILIVIFVKNSDDLWKYALIMSLSSFVANIIWIKFLKNEIHYVKVKPKEVIKYLKPSFLLFIPIFAKSIYTSMDQLMLGSLTSMSEVGLYSQSAKFMKIPYIFTNALSTIMSPKNSNLVAKNNEKQVKKNIEKSVNFIMFLVFPIVLGLIVVSDEMIPLFLGKEFLRSSNILKILLIATIFVSFANIFSTQYITPKEKDKVYVIAMCIGAVVNTILNFIFIPIFDALGAALGTLLTEFIVMLYQLSKIKKEIHILKYVKIALKYLFKSLIMFVCCSFISLLNLNMVFMLVVKIFIGVLIYLMLNINYIKNNILK